MRISHCLAICVAAFLTACSAADLANLATPRGGYELQRDLAYGPAGRQKLDLYVPEDTQPGSPIVIFVYGGNWDRGDKGDYLFAGQALASRGSSSR